MFPLHNLCKLLDRPDVKQKFLNYRSHVIASFRNECPKIDEIYQTFNKHILEQLIYLYTLEGNTTPFILNHPSETDYQITFEDIDENNLMFDVSLTCQADIFRYAYEDNDESKLLLDDYIALADLLNLEDKQPNYR